ncbi:hypothetical protein Trisim1_009754 [Trichoderma cf. simile WF8]
MQYKLLILITITSLRPSSGQGLSTNPVLWEDLADLDIFRVGDVYYYSASTMAYSPGAPLLRSYDLIHWEFMTHSVPLLDFGAQYYLNGSGSAYVGGVWASSLRYRESNDQFYWIGCVDFSHTHIFTAPGSVVMEPGAPATQWNGHPAINNCYYDCGLLIDGDDSMYVSYGSTTINVAKLTADGLSEDYAQAVYTSPNNTYIEGSRFYKINSTYYILVTVPASGEWVLKSDDIWGPYEMRILADAVTPPVAYSGNPHQGGLIETKDGLWYYAAFLDAYPGGRVPVLAPITWSTDGWPSLDIANNTWPSEIPFPIETNKTVKPLTGKDFFRGPALGPEWEWNHNPDTDAISFDQTDGGLIMKTASVTDDLFLARNTLTHRVLGPASKGTFQIDLSGIQDGDQAGMALFRDSMAFIGLSKASDELTLQYVDGLLLSNSAGNNWETISNGTVKATGPTFKISGNYTNIWLRIDVNILPAFGAPAEIKRYANFSYSFNGNDFTQLGSPFILSTSWEYFIGYRFGLFNFARKTLGGQIIARSFELESISTEIF